MKRRHLTAVAVGSLLATGVTAQPLVADAATSGVLRVSVISNGRGAPGATVSLTAISSSAIKGEPIAELAKGVADQRGVAAFSGLPKIQLARLAKENDGAVNFVATVPTAEGVRHIAFTRRFDSNGVAVGTGTTEISIGSSEALSVQQLATAAAQGEASGRRVKPLAGTCYWILDQKTTSAVTVGELHAGHDTVGTFSYGSTADSDVGVGMNIGAGWTNSGSAHVGTSGSAAVEWNNKGPVWRYPVRSSFEFGKFHYTTGPSCGTYPYKTHYMVEALRWVGGTSLGGSLTNQYGYCTTSQYRNEYGEDVSLVRKSSRAYKFDAGTSAFGVSLSAKSGYSTNVDFVLKFGHGQSSHYACGNNDYPPYSEKVWVS